MQIEGALVRDMGQVDAGEPVLCAAGARVEVKGLKRAAFDVIARAILDECTTLNLSERFF